MASEIDLSVEVIDLRIFDTLDNTVLLNSIKKTNNFVVIDGGTRTCGYSAEIIASLLESIKPNNLDTAPLRFTLPDCPAPTSSALEAFIILKKIA